MGVATVGSVGARSSVTPEVVVQGLDPLADGNVQRSEVDGHERKLGRHELADPLHCRELIVVRQTSAVDVEQALGLRVLIPTPVTGPSILSGSRGALEP